MRDTALISLPSPAPASCKGASSSAAAAASKLRKRGTDTKQKQRKNALRRCCSPTNTPFVRRLHTDNRFNKMFRGRHEHQKKERNVGSNPASDAIRSSSSASSSFPSSSSSSSRSVEQLQVLPLAQHHGQSCPHIPVGMMLPSHYRCIHALNADSAVST